jgi:histidinol dehydrogenase
MLSPSKQQQQHQQQHQQQQQQQQIQQMQNITIIKNHNHSWQLINAYTPELHSRLKRDPRCCLL